MCVWCGWGAGHKYEGIDEKLRSKYVLQGKSSKEKIAFLGWHLVMKSADFLKSIDFCCSFALKEQGMCDQEESMETVCLCGSW